VARYSPKTGQDAHDENCLRSREHCQSEKKSRFVPYVEKHVKEDGWSVDACVGRALNQSEFRRNEVVCIKTLYNYVSVGCINITNIDLPEKLKRKSRKEHPRENK
jgi:hypothetical protein